MQGMLIQLAAATAANGTYRPIRGGILYSTANNKQGYKMIQSETACCIIKTYDYNSFKKHSDETGAFRLVRRCYSSPQQCYLHNLQTINPQFHYLYTHPRLTAFSPGLPR